MVMKKESEELAESLKSEAATLRSEVHILEFSNRLRTAWTLQKQAFADDRVMLCNHT